MARVFVPFFTGYEHEHSHAGRFHSVDPQCTAVYFLLSPARLRHPAVDPLSGSPRFLLSRKAWQPSAQAGLARFVAELCELIQMRAYGETLVVHFGEEERVAGYSMVQLIETSLISGHFANLTNAAYIDIFSCKPYDPRRATRFTKEYFRAESIQVHVTNRM